MKNIKIILKFAGTNYHGWQIQKNGITVQECLNNALFSVTGEKINAVGCGRTDAGVHALGFVASFKTAASIPVEKFPYAINTALPEDIVCISAVRERDDFEASRNALKKRYVYRILNSDFPDPFLDPYTYHVKGSLDIEAMRAGAGHFCGMHDFVGFASSGFSVKTTERCIYSLNIYEENGLICIDVTGNGFLYNMVRIIAGTLISVGKHALSPEMIPEIINSRDRKRAGITAPAKGLCLMEVCY